MASIRTLAATAAMITLAALSAACGRWIEGQVTDWATGDPVPDAQVALLQSDCDWDVFIIIPIQDCDWHVRETTTTDAEGNFQFDYVPRDESLALDIAKPGYMDYFEAVRVKDRGLTRVDVQLQPEPPPSIDTLTLTSTESGIEVSWTEPDADNYEGALIVRFQGDDYPVDTPPEYGVHYRPGESLGSGAVVFAGSGGLFVDADVSEGGHYWYMAFSFSDTPAYATASPMVDTVYDCTPPPPVSDVSAVPESLWVRVSWIAPAGAMGVLIVRSQDSPLDETPQRGETYAREQEIGNGVVVDIDYRPSDGELAEELDSDAPRPAHLYYTLFAFDEFYNYSEGVSTDVIVE